MKKINILILSLFVLLTVTGCFNFKRDSMEDIDIYTTIYPLEYITNRLYGEHSTIYSIYPKGVDVDDYILTEKQIEDYSASSLFVFNGLGVDKDYVIPMFEHNNDLKIIDASMTMDFDSSVNELWLDPSNFLMLSQNVRDGLNEYIENQYLTQEINNNYEELKVEISNLDAEIRLMVESADTSTIVTSTDTLKFLEKYNINVISLDGANEKTINEVKSLISSGEIEYLFMFSTDEKTETINSLINENNLEIATVHSLSNITSSEYSAKKDYLSIMEENINLIKNELYN